MKIQSKLNIIQWDESTVKAFSHQRKVAVAAVEYKLSGDFNGTATVNYQLFYHEANTENHLKSKAQYLGLLVIEGDLQGKKGQFVLQDSGTFNQGVAESSLIIIPDSGTEELTGISGKGSYTASHTNAHLTLTITL